MRVGLIGVLVVAVAVNVFAGCGEDEMSDSASAGSVAAGEPAEEASGRAQADRRPRQTTDLRLRDSDYGPALFDDKGGALYLFTKEETDASQCYGDCARAWPPFFGRGKLRGGPGIDRGLLGKTARRDGRKQVTYAGHPLYYYAHDPRNEILCHDVFEFGGDWLVVQASGEPAPS
jgi:predicted lipoprotein with Yx(FWY)xxD motif